MGRSRYGKKIKVGIWGPGGIGGCAIRELVRLPEIELVAVRAYSKHKEGVDAGALVGIGEVGLKATTDVSRFLAAKPDCVLYAARDFNDFRGDADIVMLLEAGVNVITVLPYHYPRIRGAEIVEKFEAAGKKGGATLFGTGINPGFMYERLAALMTTLSQEIEYVRLEEYFNCQNFENEVDTLKIIGFVSTPEELARNKIAAKCPDNKIPETIAHMADILGMPLDRIVRPAQTPRNRTRFAASRMSSTRRVERMCRGCFHTEKIGALRRAMRPSRTQIVNGCCIRIRSGRRIIAIQKD